MSPKDLQEDHYTTALWHDRYLTACWFFFATTCLFAGLYGGYFSAMHDRPPCEPGMIWVFGNDSSFDVACHVLGSDGMYAIDGMSCPTECDQWFHANHPKVSLANQRRPGIFAPQNFNNKVNTKARVLSFRETGGR